MSDKHIKWTAGAYAFNDAGKLLLGKHLTRDIWLPIVAFNRDGETAEKAIRRKFFEDLGGTEVEFLRYPRFRDSVSGQEVKIGHAVPFAQVEAPLYEADKTDFCSLYICRIKPPMPSRFNRAEFSDLGWFPRQALESGADMPDYVLKTGRMAFDDWEVPF